MMCLGRLATVLVGVAVCASGCAKTSVTSIVSPDAPEYGTGQILVVAAYSDLKWRTEVEQGLQRRHPAFLASVDVLDVSALNDADAIAESFRSRQDIAALLLLGPEGAGLSESFVATEYYTGTLSKPWANTTATLYDKVKDKVVWTADASTSGNAYASWSDVRKSFVGKIFDRLHDDGLLVDGESQPRRAEVAAAAVTPVNVRWRRSLPLSTEIITLTNTDFNPAPVSGPLFERLVKGVVRVEGDRGLATAFLITRDGLALTNHHVVHGETHLLARFSDNRTAPVRVVRSNETADVALIQIHCEIDCVTVPLGSETDVSVGTEVYGLGHPAGLTASLSRGIVSGVRLADGVTWVQLDAALNQGNSGGPVIDLASGAAVALVTFKLSGSEGLGFGLAIDDALRVLGVRLR